MLSPASPDDPGITKSPLAEYVTEQTANTSSSTAHNVSRAQHLPFHHTHHKRHRLLHLIHPSGKHIHVVHHPRDLDERRRELARQHDDEKIDYELVVYGTPEHLSAVRDIQSHNLAKRETLRQKHPDVFQEFDLVHETLDHLSDELNHLTNRAIALDASFNKFGYHAHMRTIEDRHDAKHDPESGSASQSQSETDSSLQSYHDRSLQPLRFWKLPQIRQYLHKNLLWRSPESGEVGSFELFTDLIYVGVIDVIGETAVVNASAASFLHFVVVFTLAYKIWSDLTVVVNWFEVEDCVGRIAILFILCCLYGFNSNIEDFFHETFTAGIAFFLAQRCWHIAFFTLTSLEIRMIRGFLLLAALVASCSVILYIVAVHLEYPYSLIPLFFAMTVDLLAPMGTFFIVKHLKAGGNRFTQWLSKEFEFVPAVNIEHRCERTSAFTTLVFGYSVLKSLYQSRAHIGLNAFLGKGILALVQAFAIMWLYFDVDNWALHVHAIRRHWISSTCWISAHMPLAASFILASSTLSELILAHDSSNANIEDLIEAYASRSKGEIEQPLRWFYCAGLGVTLLSMTLISFCHIHKKLRSPRLTKRMRLVFRMLISLILILLPLSHHLNSLHLISITTCLFVLVLVIDLFGNSSQGDKFWTGGWTRSPDSRCKYTAKVRMSPKRREELKRKVLNGEGMAVEDALRLEKSASMDSQATTVNLGEEWHHM